MSATGSVSRNALWLFLGRVGAQLLAVVLTVVLARRLGVTGLGEYALASAVVFLANVATTFGTDMVLIREVAAEGRTDRWPAALGLQLALSAAAIAIIWAGAPLLPGQSREAVLALRVLALTLVPAAWFNVATAVLRGRARMATYAVLGPLWAAVQAAGVAAFVVAGDGAGRAAAVLLATQTLATAVVWAVAAYQVPELRGMPHVRAAEVRDLARASASIGVLGLLGVLYQRAAAIGVSVLAGPAGTGWLASSSRVVEASKGGHLALFGAVYPAMAEAHGRGDDPASRASGAGALESSWRACVALGAVVTAGLLVAGPFAIRHLYGPAFAPAGHGLDILALAVVPSTIATYQSLALLAAHREHETLRVLAVSAATLLAGLGVLVPVLGWLGAGWATLVAECVHAALMLHTRRSATTPDTTWARTPMPAAVNVTSGERP